MSASRRTSPTATRWRAISPRSPRLRARFRPKSWCCRRTICPFSGCTRGSTSSLAHHQARCEEILSACVTPQSAVDLLPLLFRRPLDRHQTAFALGEALAHLHYLMGQGALDRVLGSDGVYRFGDASG